MALAPSINTAARDDACNAIVDRLDLGNEAAQLRIYDGTPPANASAALSSNTLLAALTMSDPAFGSSSSGVATADTITQDASADATGTASFFRCGSMNTGTFTSVIQGTVGTSGCDLNLASTAIVESGAVSVTALTYTHSAS